jgi:hypothetical protein
MFGNLSAKRIELQKRLVRDLGGYCEILSLVSQWPLIVKIKSIGIILAIYIYPNTNPHGGRALEEYKFNLKVPGQKINERSNFDSSLGLPLLLSYAEDYDTYIIYEARKHIDFLWSSNIQSRVELLRSASINGIARMTKKNGETLIGVISSKLSHGINESLIL